MQPISGSHHHVRFQMQPAALAKANPPVGRGTSFAKKLGQAGGANTPDKPGLKVKKRKVAPQFDNADEMEMQARLLAQQLQAKPAGKSGPAPRNPGV